MGDLERPLVSELIESVKQYASDKSYELAGGVKVTIHTDASLTPGRFEVQAISAVDGPDESAPRSPSDTEDSSNVSTSVTTERQAPAPYVPPIAPMLATPSIQSVPAAAPGPVTKEATLVLGDGTRIAMKVGVASVRRSAESTVHLNDTNVSRRHAEIRSRGEGANLTWVLVDLGSTNGTMLNGVKITGEQKLKNGDALMFGSTPARFEVA